MPLRIIRDSPQSVDLDEFLCRPLFAHLATASEDGPRGSPVWFLWEEGALCVIGNLKTDTFPARVRSEPRCAVGIVDFDPVTGLVHHVGFRGRATVEPWDRQRAERLLARYLGPDQATWDDHRFRQPLDDLKNVLVRSEPETPVVRDQSYRVAGRGPRGTTARRTLRGPGR